MAEPQNGSLNDLVGMGGPKFRLNKPDLPKTEALFAGPAQAREGFVTAEQAAPALAEQRAEEARLTQEVGQADVAIEAAKLERDRIKAEQKGALVKKQKEELALLPEAQQLKQKREQFTNLTFVPTRDNAEDLAKLFSLIGVIGVAIGGRGRGAALQAMTSMNGMLEGYRRGRADLYKQQLGEFDRSLKTMQQQISTLEKQLTEAVKLKALDREAGELAIDAAIASADSPLLKAIAAKQGPVAALAHVRATGKDFNTLITLKNQQQDRANQLQARQEEQRALREFQREERLAREQFQARQSATEAARRNLQVVQTDQGPRVIDVSTLPRLTQDELAGATPFKGKGGQKPPTDVEKTIRLNSVALDAIDPLVGRGQELLKTGFKGVGVISGMVPYGIAQNYMSEKERAFVQEFMRMTNKEIKDQSGATVTVQEFARQRGVLPLRNDRPEVVLDKLKTLKGMLAQETAVIGRAYPKVVNQYGIVLPIPERKEQLVRGLTYNTSRGNAVWDGKAFVIDQSGDEE